ncbi:unnamed protein product [Meloidogyne enterolobii]|uniref:Uncharacterized protein n=1 Tax=Meloidogyne enterolobii TaxID=390850 RepID=A0ACB1B9Y9_MELEN
MIRKKRYYSSGPIFGKRPDAFISHTIVSGLIIVLVFFKAIGLYELRCRFPEVNLQNFLRRRQNSPLTIHRQREQELREQYFHPQPSYPHRYSERNQYYNENPYYRNTERNNMALGRQNEPTIHREMHRQDFQPRPNIPDQYDEENPPQLSSVSSFISDDAEAYQFVFDSQPRPRRSIQKGLIYLLRGHFSRFLEWAII